MTLAAGEIRGCLEQRERDCRWLRGEHARSQEIARARAGNASESCSRNHCDSTDGVLHVRAGRLADAACVVTF